MPANHEGYIFGDKIDKVHHCRSRGGTTAENQNLGCVVLDMVLSCVEGLNRGQGTLEALSLR